MRRFPLPGARPLLTLGAVFLPSLLSAQTGLVVQQHVTFNVAKVTSADLTQTTSILGADRAKTVTTGKTKVLIISSDASGTEVMRLDKDSVYRVNDKKKEYTARSLTATRDDLAKQQQNAEKQATEMKQSDVKYSVTVDEAKNTGEKQTINGFSTEHVVIKLTVVAENTKTGEKTPAYHITSDSWVDRSQNEAGKASMAYRAEQIKALGIDPAMATNPYARWLTNVDLEAAKFSGYPIKSTLTMMMPVDSTKPAEQKPPEPPPTSVRGAMIGAMFGGGKKKEEPAPSGGMVLFTSTVEVLSISFKAPSASEFEIPAGYTKK